MSKEQSEILTTPIGQRQRDCRIVACENGFIVNAIFYGMQKHSLHACVPIDAQVIAENKCFVFPTQSEMISWINRYFLDVRQDHDTAADA